MPYYHASPVHTGKLNLELKAVREVRARHHTDPCTVVAQVAKKYGDFPTVGIHESAGIAILSFVAWLHLG